MAAPTAWAAFLRAVNVGGRNTVPMARLRELLAAEGCTSVATYVQSGNAVFDHPAPSAERLAAAIEADLGVTTVVVLRSAAELRALAGAPPATGVAFAHAMLLEAEPAADAVARLAAAATGRERAEVRGRDVVLELPSGVGRARLGGAAVERLLGVRGTLRNWRTLTAVAGLAGDPARRG